MLSLRYRRSLLIVVVFLLLLTAIMGLNSTSAASPHLTSSAAIINAAFDPGAGSASNGGIPANAPAGGSVTLVGSKVLTQDLSLSSTPGVGALNATIMSQTFGTGGYLLFNYNGGTSFITCNPPTTTCPASPNANDYICSVARSRV